MVPLRARILLLVTLLAAASPVAAFAGSYAGGGKVTRVETGRSCTGYLAAITVEETPALGWYAHVEITGGGDHCAPAAVADMVSVTRRGNGSFDGAETRGCEVVKFSLTSPSTSAFFRYTVENYCKPSLTYWYEGFMPSLGGGAHGQQAYADTT